MTRLTAVSSLVSSLVLGGLLLAAPSVAQAQEPGPTPVATTTAAGGTDHSQVVGTFGVGYLGLGNIRTGGEVIDAPIVGVRYWLSEGMGIDAGLGLGYRSSKSTTKGGGTTVEREQPAPFGVLLHGGVPLALATGKHHTFQVVPELNIGYGTSTLKQEGADDTDRSGLLLELGARAGTEIHFGFMGLPRLALQGTVGVRFSYTSQTTKQGDGETTDSQIGFGTTVQSAPWAIFTSNLAALYYF